ncbi:sulfur carrier protein ThiS [Phycisphaeraceae bacterium D3-23]
MPTITLNGEPHTTDAASIADLLKEQGLEGQAVAVELNQSVVPKREHADQPLQDGDHIELVTLVGGG